MDGRTCAQVYRCASNIFFIFFIFLYAEEYVVLFHKERTCNPLELSPTYLR